MGDTYRDTAPRIEVCPDCPNAVLRDKAPLIIGPLKDGEAVVWLREDSLSAVYKTSDGSTAGKMYESAVALTDEIPDEAQTGEEVFRDCIGARRDRIAQKLRLSPADCPALEQIFGDPSDGDLVYDYIQARDGSKT